MVGAITFSLLAAALGVPPATPTHLSVSVSARASVRIVSAARISLSDAPQPEGYAMKPAQVTVEDGTKQDAQLVEFQ